MVLYLKLDQKVWGQSDYTDSSSFDLSGTVYDENTLATARDISGYTGTFRLLDNRGNLVFSSSTGLTLNADGTFTMTFAEGSSPYTTGNHVLRLRLESSGNRLTCIGVNGSDYIFIEDS